MATNQKTRAERASDLLSFYSINELADSMGVTNRTVKRWAKGESQPNDKNFKKIYRREYYWKGAKNDKYFYKTDAKKEKRGTLGSERSRTVKSSLGARSENPDIVKVGGREGGVSAFDLIRRIEGGTFNPEVFEGKKFIDFRTFVGSSREPDVLDERLYTFVNPDKGGVDENELISFLYRIFRENEDAFEGSDIIVEIDTIEV